jgi:hypothetical protein
MAAKKAPPPAPPQKQVEAHAPFGQKTHYVRAAVTLSPEAYDLVAVEALRRRKAGEPNAQVGAVIREAVVGWWSPGGPGTKRGR